MSARLLGQCFGRTTETASFDPPKGNMIHLSTGVTRYLAIRNPLTGAFSLSIGQEGYDNVMVQKTSSSEAASRMGVALFGDSSCTEQLSTAVQIVNVCHRHRVGHVSMHIKSRCVDDKWTVHGFTNSYACDTDTDAFSTTGSGKEACSLLVHGIYVKATCDGSAFPEYDPTGWLGQYSVSGCNQTACCCLTSANIAQSFGLYTLSATVAGRCANPSAFRSEIDPPTSDSDMAQQLEGGRKHRAIRHPSNESISFFPTVPGHCNAVLTKRTTDGSGSSSASSSTQVTIDVFSDAACSQRLVSATQPSGACRLNQVLGNTVYLTATCIGERWSASGHLTDQCAGAGGWPQASVASIGPHVCAFAANTVDGGIYVKVACRDGPLSTAAHTVPTLAMLMLTLVAYAWTGRF